MTGSPPDPDLIAYLRDLIETALSETFERPVVLADAVPEADSFLAHLAQHVAALEAVGANGHAFNGHASSDQQHPDNRLNDLSGAEWLWFTKSVLRTSYPSILGHDLRKLQGGNKPPQLMQELIAFFTKRGETVLDPFGGAGGTALGAHLAGRQSVSIELNPESASLYHTVCTQEGIEPHPFLIGDCRAILPTLPADHFDFIATDPPYSPELEKTMSVAAISAQYNRSNRRSGYISYSDDPRDLSKSDSFAAFFAALEDAGRQMLRVLKPRRYLAMILRDAYQGGEYIHTSAIMADRYRALGWTFKGEKIWYSTGVRIRPYGYPRAFVPNIIHQNILIFRKEMG